MTRWKLPSPTWPKSGMAARRARCPWRFLGHAFGEARDRHADVGRKRARPRLELQAGEVGVVPRFPELGTLLLLGRPLEVEPAVLARDVLHRFRLLDDRRGAAVKFEKERALPDRSSSLRRLRAAMVVAQRSSLRAIGIPAWSVSITVFAAPSISGNAHRGRHRLLHRVQLHRHFGDDAERALGADEEPRQVVARGRSSRGARSG